MMLLCIVVLSLHSLTLPRIWILHYYPRYTHAMKYLDVLT